MASAGQAAPVGWQDAMTAALYGPAGFYVTGAGPERHFRTSATASPVLAGAIHRLVADVDGSLGLPDPLDVVDVGAGDGSLLAAVAGLVTPEQRCRWRLHGVDLRARPDGLPDDVAWSRAPSSGLTGVVVAHELLDNVPLDVVEVTAQGLRRVLVSDDGTEALAGPPDEDDVRWLTAWWPMSGAEPGDRAEIGRTRDAEWAGLVRLLERGVAVAVDYSHTLDDRRAGRWAAGTLSGYRAGRQVPPVPDGSCDLTAHVALDACERAGLAAGATASLLTDQRTALRRLDVTAALPPITQAHVDPVAYVQALSQASHSAELLRAGGWGGFGWLMQGVGCPLPIPDGHGVEEGPSTGGAPAGR